MVLVDDRDLFEEEQMLGSPQIGTGIIDIIKKVGTKLFGTVKEVGKKLLPALLPILVDVLSGKQKLGKKLIPALLPAVVGALSGKGLGSQIVGGILPKFPRLRIDKSGRLIRGRGLKIV